MKSRDLSNLLIDNCIYTFNCGRMPPDQRGRLLWIFRLSNPEFHGGSLVFYDHPGSLIELSIFPITLFSETLQLIFLLKPKLFED
jgi:hypothetical protein